MKPRLRFTLTWGWGVLVVAFAAGVVVYVFAADSASEQDHRATVWATVLAAVVIVPPVVVWASRCPVADPAGLGVSSPEQAQAAARLLAIRMSATWSQQERIRGIRLPAPVRVCWRWASPCVAVPREEVNASPAGFTDPSPISGAGGGEVLGSGVVTRLHEEVYARLRHGRLVLIGGPGAGKTAAMILLLLAALDHRKRMPAADRAEVPVPVWLTLGSWNPKTQTLRAWVTATIARDHPYLRAADFGPDAIGALFDTGQVALFLDGLDEMPDAQRSQAIHRLRCEADGLRVVLTSRPDEYRATLDDGAHLPETAVIELRPVGVTAAVDYLLADRTEPARQAWTRVTDRLRAEPAGVLARTLNSPLTLSLAHTAHPVDPAPLLDPALGTEQALRAHLLDQVLVTAYPDPRERARATYWLGWIAHRMNTNRDLHWWDIPTWTTRWQIRTMRGSTAGLITGLLNGLVFGPVSGLMGGLMVGFMVGSPDTNAPQELYVHRPNGRRLGGLLVDGSSFGLGAGLVGGRAVSFGLGFGFGIAWGLLKLWSRPSATTHETNPIEVYRSDRRRTLVHWLVFGIGFGFGFGLVFRLTGGLVYGLGLGLGFGLRFGLGPTVDLAVVEMLRCLLGRRVRFMPLLQTGLDRQVLRQAGAVYQFRHADLQDRLADRYRREHLGLDGRATEATVVDLTRSRHVDLSQHGGAGEVYRG